MMLFEMDLSRFGDGVNRRGEGSKQLLCVE